MIGVSEAAPPRAVNQPELAVDELSQICEGLARQRPENMPALLNALALIAPLLNAIPNVVFFIKDREARYLLANLTLARRCGFKTVSSLLGKTSADVFPSTLGQGYTEQDLRVLREGVTLRDQLEMHLYNGRERGWCLTQKLALRDVRGQVIAMEELTALSGMSIAQIERYCKRIFHLTPRQMIHKVRLEKATELLAGDTPITDIALQCGYTDHSAFSRQFKAMTGSTPRDFRLTLQG